MATEVPFRSTRTVEVETGRVVDLEIIFVAWRVDVKVWPGNVNVLMIQDVYVSIAVDFEAATVLVDEVLTGKIDVLVD